MDNGARVSWPAWRYSRRPQRPFCAACLIIASLAYPLVVATGAEGATYYLDAVSGDDSNPGTSDQPWKTLGRAYTWYGGDGSKVQEGDTVLFRNGNYGQFKENLTSVATAPHRSNWITYKAATGHIPILSQLYIYNRNPSESYTIIDGFRIENAVKLYYTSYIQVKNCVVSLAITVPYEGYNAPYYEPGSSTICSTDVSYLTISDCNAYDSCFPIQTKGTGTNLTFARNDLHHIGEDGIHYGGTTVNTLAEGNYIHTWRKHSTGIALKGTVNGSFEIRQTVTQAGTGAEGIVYVVSSTQIGVYEISEAEFADPDMGGGIITGPSGTINPFTDQDPAHTDGISVQGPTSGVIWRGNIIIGPTIRGTTQGFKFSSENVAALIDDVLLENNLIYSWGQSLSITSVTNLRIYNNTFMDDPSNGIQGARFACGVGNTTITEMYNNIMDEFYQLGDKGSDTIKVRSHGHNIFGDVSPGGPTYPFVLNSTEAISSNLNALFTNAAGNDYTLAAGSAAIDFGNPDYGPSMDILGKSHVGAPDAGCYEYVSPGSGNHAPVLESIGNKSINENTLLTFTLSATDADGDTVTYSATGLPTGATLTGQSFTWTPGYTQAGAYDVNFVAGDGTDTDSETVTVTVSNVNRAPVLSAIGGKSVNENVLLTFTISATDADGETIIYSASDLPTGATFAGQTFTWTPGYDQAGSASVTFTASDGHTQDTETVTITVSNTNRVPVLDDIADKSVNENTLLTFAVSATDPDGDPLTYSATGLPSGATFAGQTFSWTPSSSQADSSHQVTFIAGDGQLDDSQIVTITVTDTLAPSVTNLSPAAGSIQAPLNSLIILHVTDAGKGVNAGTVTITLDGSTICSGDTSNYVSATGNCRRTGTKADYAYAYQSGQNLDFDQTKTITVNATDLGGNVMSQQSYSFRTEMRSFGQNKLLGSDIEGLDKGAPATVRDSSGNIWAAWHAGPAGSRDIYLAKLTPGSSTFGAGTQITTDAADQCNPAVALGTDDKLYVVWQDNRLGDWDVYGSTSTGGTTWSAQQRITDSNDNQINPAIAVDRQSPNRAHVVWQDDRAGNQDIYIATSSNSFVTNTVTRITSNTADQTAPAVVVSSSNTVYVLWTDGRNSSSDIYGAAGSSWTNVPVVTKAADQSSPAVAVESTGSILHILWVDQTSGNSDIYYASSNGLPGSPLTGTNLIDDTSGAEQTSPAIAVTGSTGSSLKVFACWNDARNISGGAGDTDIYLVQANAGSGTNVLISDAGANSNQTEPATGTDQYGYPYIVWTDDRGANTEIYFAASTFMQSSALASQLITAASGGTVGAEPASITGVDDVSIVLPAGACPYDVTITIAKIENPHDGTLPLLNGYDFSPSGIVFSTPVTITMPYAVTGAAGVPMAYWYNSRTGDLSQQEITNIEVIVITPTLHALRFKTTHFTPFYALLGAAAAGGGGGGGGGGCSVSPAGQSSILEMLVPCLGLAVVMAILKLRDARNRNARNCDPPRETIPSASGAHLRQSRAIASKYVGL